MKSIKKEHILKALAEIDKEGVRKGRESNTYDMVFNGKKYPPKLVISIANRFAYGEELDHKTFSGGINTEAFNLLENEGFIIKSKMDRVLKLIDKYKRKIKKSQLEGEKYKWELIKGTSKN